MSDGISGFGTTLTGATTGAIAEILSVSLDGQEVSDLDGTTMDSTNRWKEYFAGLKEPGELSLELLYEDDNFEAIQAALGGENEVWTVALPDGASFSSDGYLKANGFASPHDERILQSVTLKLSGEPTFVEVSGS